MMNEKVISLADVDEVCDFVRAAGMCDFDIDISDQRMVIDAKSILGVMALDFSGPLCLKYDSEDSAIKEKIMSFILNCYNLHHILK